jgi:hypothetical protein
MVKGVVSLRPLAPNLVEDSAPHFLPCGYANQLRPILPCVSYTSRHDIQTRSLLDKNVTVGASVNAD